MATKTKEQAAKYYKTWKSKQPPTYERDRKLKTKYGITRQDFDKQLARQGRKCLGCRKDVDETACVDHDHESGRWRGILCDGCNFVLGATKDDKSTLRRLMAYLDYDLTQTNVYLIGSLRNREVQGVAASLRKVGYTVWDDWQAVGPDADDWWRDYEQAKGHNFSKALEGISAQNTYHFDKAYIDLADMGILVMPAGRSGHLELGYMQGQGKPTYILLDKEPERYDVMAQFATGVCSTTEELLENLSRVKLQESGENAVR